MPGRAQRAQFALVLSCIPEIGIIVANLDRVRVAWSGFTGAPGVSTFYATAGGTLVPQLHSFFDAIKAYFPIAMHINCETSGDSIESTTGELTGQWVGGAFAGITGTVGTTWAAPSGVLVRWDSATILGGRRLRGHTFLVPLVTSIYDTNGQVSAAVQGVIQTAATALVTASAGNMVVYQRERAAKAADGSRKAVTQRDGSFGPVTASRVSLVPAILSSRRD